MTCEKKKSEKAYHSKKKVEGKRIRKKKTLLKCSILLRFQVEKNSICSVFGGPLVGHKARR